MLGLARVGAPWFSAVAHWATSAALPVEFVKAISADEAKVRLEAGRPYSALLVDEAVAGFDRDLLLTAEAHDCTVLVVSGGGPGVALVDPANLLPRELTRDDLHRALSQLCRPVDRRDAPVPGVAPPPPGLRGHLVAITGAGGTGRSTVAMALAQVLGSDARRTEQVCLADCCLVADQGTLHGAPDVVPSVLELSDAHRTGRPTADEVRGATWRVEGRGYHLLLGLRRRRDWTSLRARSFVAALDGLRAAFGLVLADTDDDLDGERATGSLDLEERNAMARTCISSADLVVIVGSAGLIGLHHLVRVTREVLDTGVSPDRILPTVNRSNGGRRRRAQLDRAFGQLLLDTGGPPVPTPLHLPTRKGIDLALLDCERLPDDWVAPLASSVAGLLAQPLAPPTTEPQPVPIGVGELGHWEALDDEAGPGG